jgi:hypothetical protein
MDKISINLVRPDGSGCVDGQRGIDHNARSGNGLWPSRHANSLCGSPDGDSVDTTPGRSNSTNRQAGSTGKADAPTHSNTNLKWRFLNDKPDDYPSYSLSALPFADSSSAMR